MISLIRTCSVLAMTAAFANFAWANERVNFLLDWLPSGDKAAVYLGVEKGLFAAEGLDVAIQSARGSSEVVTKLATGAADMGTGGLSALLQAKANGDVPVTAVMSIYTKQPDAIFTTEEAGIKSLKDLAGKTVATATFSSSNVSWPLVLKANGVDADSVKLLKVDPGALAPMLAAGKVDATINWVTVAPAFAGPVAEAGKHFKALPWSDMGFEGYGLSIFASDEMLAKHPDAVKKFLSAFARATGMAIADPDAAAEALKAKVPEIDTKTAAAAWRASVPLIVNDISKKDGMGAFAPARLATTWKWVAEAQHVPLDKIDPEKAVTREFMAGAAAPAQ